MPNARSPISARRDRRSPAIRGGARHELGDALRALGLTAPGLKRLSFQMSLTKNIAGRPLASACCCISGHTVSTKGSGCAAATSTAAAMPFSTSSLSAGSGQRRSANATASGAITAGRARENAPPLTENSWGYPVESAQQPQPDHHQRSGLQWPARDRDCPECVSFHGHDR